MGICRKTLCIIVASLFVFSAFAAPGGGGAGGHGGGPGGGGRGPAGSSRGAPGGMRPSGGSSVRSSGGSNRTKNSSNSVRPSQSKQNSPSNQLGPSSSFFQNGSPTGMNNPSLGGQGDKGGENNTRHRDEMAADSPVSNERMAPEMINYRGNRILSEGAEFVLQDVKSERINSGEVSLEISFNQSVNPLSFSSDSILIDGMAVPSKIKFSFNKKGDTIRMSVPSKSEKMNILIQNVESFDGTVISPVLIEVK